MHNIEQVFGPDGPLAAGIEGYAPRAGQVAYARFVADIIANGWTGLAEGPTGTGKSFGYLVPMILYAPRPIAVCTANINLQEQLVAKDLPLLRRLLGHPFDYALLKGRSNYLCRRKARKATARAQNARDFDAEDLRQLRDVRAWAAETSAGDISELPFQLASSVRRLYISSADECLGRECLHAGECHADLARARAKGADVVVTNYHMLFSHVNSRQMSGKPDAILPDYKALVLDEAHKIHHIARDFHGWRWSYYGLRQATRVLYALDDADCESLARDVRDVGGQFFDALAAYERSGRYRARLRDQDVVDWWEELYDLLTDLQTTYTELMGSQKLKVDKDELLSARKWAKDGAAYLREAMLLENSNRVYALERRNKGREVAIVAKAFDVAPYLRQELFNKVRCSVITSATLYTGNSCKYLADELGVADCSVEYRVDSPFDWATHALCVLPMLPVDPSDHEFDQVIAPVLRAVIDSARGRTLVLFASNRAMDYAYERLHQQIEVLGYRVLKQGQAPNSVLLRQFREDVQSVLFGVESFWAGVDVQGESLSCVVIHKLPFPSPADPIVDRYQELEGRQSFMTRSVPQAIIALKQGVGRLIRTTKDRGVVVLLDKRISTKSYGALFRQSLPVMPWDNRVEAVREFLG